MRCILRLKRKVQGTQNRSQFLRLTNADFHRGLRGVVNLHIRQRHLGQHLHLEGNPVIAIAQEIHYELNRLALIGQFQADQFAVCRSELVSITASPIAAQRFLAIKSSQLHSIALI